MLVIFFNLTDMTRIMLTLQPRALQNNLGPFRKHLTTLDPSKIPYNPRTFKQQCDFQKIPYNPGPFKQYSYNPGHFRKHPKTPGTSEISYNPGHSNQPSDFQKTPYTTLGTSKTHVASRIIYCTCIISIRCRILILSMPFSRLN